MIDHHAMRKFHFLIAVSVLFLDRVPYGAAPLMSLVSTVGVPASDGTAEVWSDDCRPF